MSSARASKQYTLDMFYAIDGLNNDDIPDETIVITVNPEPVITAGQTKTICSGDQVDYEVLLTPVNLPAGSIFNWSAPTMSDASVQGTAGSDVAADPAGTLQLTDVLENKTGASITATYTITPTSADGCEGDPVSVVITIDPEPVIVSAQTKTICSDDAVNLEVLMTESIPF